MFPGMYELLIAMNADNVVPETEKNETT